MEKDISKIRETISSFAKSIAVEVADKRYYNVDEIKLIAETRLEFALWDIVQINVLLFESEKERLIVEYTDPSTPNWRKQKLQGEIRRIGNAKKKFNRVHSSLSDYNEYRQLKTFVTTKFGEEVLRDFIDNFLNKEENVLHKSKITPAKQVNNNTQKQ